jgi:hypothetical protein
LVAEYTAEFLNLATQSGLRPTHSIQLIFKSSNGRYKDLAVLTLKQAESEKYNLALLIAHIIAVLATLDTILTSNSETACTHPQQQKAGPKPYTLPSNTGNKQKGPGHLTYTSSGYGGAAPMDLNHG